MKSKRKAKQLARRVAKAGPPAIEIPLPGPYNQVSSDKPSPWRAMGTTGLLRTKGPLGYVYEEWLPQLAGQEGRRVYREMWDNDAVLGAIAFKLQMVLRRAEWHLKPAFGTGAKGDDAAEYVDSCKDDMLHSWADTWAEWTNVLPQGFIDFEVTFKRRLGPRPGKKPSSKFNDGLIGWRDWSPRAAESMYWWDWDEDTGEISAAIQLAPPDYKTVRIPMEQLIHFTTTSNKRNPEGRSVLRNCYVSYTRKKRLEEIEGIGAERDATGYPVLYISAEAMAQLGNGDLEAGRQAAEQIIQGFRVDDQMGAILPPAYDQEGHRQVELALVASPGAKQVDVGAIITRHNRDMLTTMLCGFLQLGQTSHGARNLAEQAGLDFCQAITAYVKSGAGVVNRTAIPRLLAMNQMDPELCPTLEVDDLSVTDLQGLAEYITALASAGVEVNDPDTKSYLRKKGGLPEETEGMPPTDPALQQQLAATRGGVPSKTAPKKPDAAPAEDNAEGSDRLDEAAA